MQIFSAYRNQRCRKEQLDLDTRDIASIGIMQKRRGIPVLQFSQRKSHYQWLMGWE